MTSTITSRTAVTASRDQTGADPSTPCSALTAHYISDRPRRPQTRARRGASAWSSAEACRALCSGDHDDGIADGNLTACSRASGCGLPGCPYVSDYVRAAGFAVSRPYSPSSVSGRPPSPRPPRARARPAGPRRVVERRRGAAVPSLPIWSVTHSRHATTSSYLKTDSIE